MLPASAREMALFLLYVIDDERGHDGFHKDLTHKPGYID